MNITLYTTHCPKCKVLETKLQQRELEYETVEDENIMVEKGFLSAPMLEIDGEVFDFSGAINWLKAGGNK